MSSCDMPNQVYGGPVCNMNDQIYLLQSDYDPLSDSPYDSLRPKYVGSGLIPVSFGNNNSGISGFDKTNTKTSYAPYNSDMQPEDQIMETKNLHNPDQMNEIVYVKKESVPSEKNKSEILTGTNIIFLIIAVILIVFLWHLMKNRH